MNINLKGGYFNVFVFNKIRLDFVHGQCPVSPWTQWTLSMDIVQHPGCPWTMSSLFTESMDNVHWIHGHCPVWLVSLDFVHGLTGLCPECPWTLSRLYWVHGQCPGSPLSPWTSYRLELGWSIIFPPWQVKASTLPCHEYTYNLCFLRGGEKLGRPILSHPWQDKALTLCRWLSGWRKTWLVHYFPTLTGESINLD